MDPEGGPLSIRGVRKLSSTWDVMTKDFTARQENKSVPIFGCPPENHFGAKSCNTALHCSLPAGCTRHCTESGGMVVVLQDLIPYLPDVLGRQKARPAPRTRARPDPVFAPGPWGVVEDLDTRALFQAPRCPTHAIWRPWVRVRRACKENLSRFDRHFYAAFDSRRIR